jgi:hypothetical protein
MIPPFHLFLSRRDDPSFGAGLLERLAGFREFNLLEAIRDQDSDRFALQCLSHFPLHVGLAWIPRRGDRRESFEIVGAYQQNQRTIRIGRDLGCACRVQLSAAIDAAVILVSMMHVEVLIEEALSLTHLASSDAGGCADDDGDGRGVWSHGHLFLYGFRTILMQSSSLFMNVS